MKRISIILFAFLLFNSCKSTDLVTQQKITTARVIAQEFLEYEKIPGMSISVSQNDKLIWSEGFGYSNIESKKIVSPKTTQFRIASISKSLTAVALAKLMEDGKLDFDESIYTYVPDFPKKNMTFRFVKLVVIFLELDIMIIQIMKKSYLT